MICGTFLILFITLALPKSLTLAKYLKLSRRMLSLQKKTSNSNEMLFVALMDFGVNKTVNRSWFFFRLRCKSISCGNHNNATK